MPKEKIYDEAEMYDIVIGWARDKWVQIGIETHNGKPIADMIAANSDDPAEFTGLWGTFDRAGLNRLIKEARRARDAAFGKDA